MIVRYELGDMNNPDSVFKHRSPHHGPVVDICISIYVRIRTVHVRSEWESG